MKSDVRKTLSVIFTCVFVFGVFQHTAPAADERQTLQEVSKRLAEIAQEVGKTVVGIETERSDEDRDQSRHFEHRRRSPEGWEWFGPQFRNRFRRNSNQEEDEEHHFFFRVPDRDKRERRHSMMPEAIFPPALSDQAAFGSGILLDEQGHIATVIELVNDSREVIVTLRDGTRLDAIVIGSDKETGIAVVKVDVNALPATKFGDSDQISIGELMLALGHTANQEPAVYFGMISGVGRNPHVFNYENWIEIDTNLRPGSGGGAIVNTNGEIIGMSVANPPARPFAIPINTVRHIAIDLIEHREVARGWLGVMIQDVDLGLADKLGLDKPMGALINDVGRDTPAKEAGLQKGDVLIAVEGQAIEDPNHLRHVIAMYKPGTTISVTVMREGEKLDISVTLDERSEGVLRHLTRNTKHLRKGDWKGLSVQNLTEALAEKFGYTPDEGVLISGVTPGSPAAEAGIHKGDVLLEVEHQPVHNVDEFKLAVKTDAESILLQVKRNKQVLFLVVK
jgi:serine protease Do